MPVDSDDTLNLLPPGYKFCPTDRELIKYYLKRKVLNLRLPPNNIKQVNIYKHNPQQLYDMFKEPGEEKMYFFTSRDRKYLNGSRPNRVAENGFWKASGAFTPIGKKKKNSNPIGYKRSLVYYQGKHKEDPKKTDWLMVEYTINQIASTTPNHDMKLDDCVLSKVYKSPRKSEKGQMEDDEASFIMKYAAMIDGIFEPEWPLMQLEPNSRVPELPNTPHSDAMPSSGSPMSGDNRQDAASMPHPADAISPRSSSPMLGHQRQNGISMPESNHDSLVQNTGQDCYSIWPTVEEINMVYPCNMPNHSSFSLLNEEGDFKYDFSMPDQFGF